MAFALPWAKRESRGEEVEFRGTDSVLSVISASLRLGDLLEKMGVVGPLSVAHLSPTRLARSNLQLSTSRDTVERLFVRRVSIGELEGVFTAKRICSRVVSICSCLFLDRLSKSTRLASIGFFLIY